MNWINKYKPGPYWCFIMTKMTTRGGGGSWMIASGGTFRPHLVRLLHALLHGTETLVIYLYI